MNPDEQLLDKLSLRVLAITYNMWGKVPTSVKQLDQLFQKDNVQHDLYIFGT